MPRWLVVPGVTSACAMEPHSRAAECREIGITAMRLCDRRNQRRRLLLADELKLPQLLRRNKLERRLPRDAVVGIGLMLMMFSSCSPANGVLRKWNGLP
jgi:hypothetical protein